MAVSRKNKFKFYLFLIVVLVGLSGILFNREGLFKYMKLKSEINDLNEKITTLQESNKRLQGEIDSLKNNVPAKIEQVAREKYGMMRKGEKKIEVIEK